MKIFKAITSAFAFLIRKTRDALNTPNDPKRIPIWSVSGVQSRLFFPLASILWLAALAKIVYDRRTGIKEHTIDTLLAIMTEFGPMVLAIAAIAMIVSACLATIWQWAYKIRRAIAMNVLDRWIAKMERPAREEGKAEGKTEGRAEGIELGIDWATRKAQAEAQGLPFDEPRPGPTPEEPPE